MDILKNIDIEKINTAVKQAIQIKKEISNLKKEVLQLSKDAIEFLEGGDVSSAEAALFASERKINKIHGCLRRSPITLHFQGDMLYSVEKEYCEAVIVCFVMKNQEIPSYEELNVDPLVFIHSFVEAVSELGKINEKLENRAKITANKMAMQEIFMALEQMKHYAGNMTGDMDNQLDKLRHKIYSGKTNITITPEDVAAWAVEPQRSPVPTIIEPNPQINREIMQNMSKVIASVNGISADSELRDFKKTWKKVSDNLRTGLIETKSKEPKQEQNKNTDFEINGTVLTAYNGKDAKIEIPAGVTEITADAFGVCSEAVTIKIPASVKKIHPRAFADCRNLSVLWVDSKNDSFSHSMGILYNKNKTALVCYPANDKTKHKKSLPVNLTTICEGAFVHCRNLEILNLSEGITDIHKAAFIDCFGLKISAPAGSAAYKYAKARNMLKEAPEETAVEDIGVYFRNANTEKNSETVSEPTDIDGVYFRDADNAEAISDIADPANDLVSDAVSVNVTAEADNDVPAGSGNAAETASEPADIDGVYFRAADNAEAVSDIADSAIDLASDAVSANETAEADNDVPADSGDTAETVSEPTDIDGVYFRDADDIVGSSSDNTNNLSEAETDISAEAGEPEQEQSQQNQRQGTIREQKPKKTAVTNKIDAGKKKNTAVNANKADNSRTVEAQNSDRQEQSQYTIRSNTKTLRQGTFRGQKPKKAVVIGGNIIKIDVNAFDELSDLRSISVKKESSGFCSVDGVLYSKDRKTLLRYPAAKSNVKYSIDAKTTAVASHAFAGCRRLKTIHLPDNEVAIAPDAFDEETEIKLKNAKAGTAAHSFAKEKGML